MHPAVNQAGTASIVLSVTDAGGLVATSRFDIVVQMFTDASRGLARLQLWRQRLGRL